MSPFPVNIPDKTLPSGFAMPAFGFGTWQMGGRYECEANNDDAGDIAAIRAAIERGITHLDSAEIYADGYAEVLLGEAIAPYDRAGLFLSSKVGPRHASYDGVLIACHGSLARLGVDYLDLYLLHFLPPEGQLREVIEALDWLQDQGLIRHAGVCNFGVERLREARSYARHPIEYDMVHYNLAYREPEASGLLRFCQDNGVLLQAWRPTQKGILAGDVPPLVHDLAAKYGKTPVQIAINWLVSQDNVTTLAKTRDIQHLEENLGAIGWNMEAADIERLRKEYPSQRDQSDAVPLDTVPEAVR